MHFQTKKATPYKVIFLLSTIIFKNIFCLVFSKKYLLIWKKEKKRSFDSDRTMAVLRLKTSI